MERGEVEGVARVGEGSGEKGSGGPIRLEGQEATRARRGRGEGTREGWAFLDLRRNAHISSAVLSSSASCKERDKQCAR